MFIKQILCQVKHGQQKSFSNGQSKWDVLKDVDGLIAQFGGWSETKKNVACIFSLWDEKNSYIQFMDNEHDEIASHVNQETSVSSITTRLFGLKLKIEGSLHCLDPEILNKSNYFRFTNSKVNADKSLHFEETQSNLWNRYMSKEKGMLGGWFAKSDLANEYLVLTGWNNKNDHSNYSENTLPYLIKESNVNSNVWNVDGDQFVTEKSWLIL